MTDNNLEENEMCLNSTFKEACIKVYKTCNTATGKCLPKPVQDEYVAIINITNQTSSIQNPQIIYCNDNQRPKEETDKIREENNPTICLVLESPHEKEYDSKGKPLGPALSTTGKNIREHLKDILNDAIKNRVISIPDGKYSLLLIEAVSYQCSNAQSLKIKENKENRDKVFTEVWENGGKENFLKRIGNADPILIINSCTGGIKNVDDVNYLNGKIKGLLVLAGYDEKTVNSSHPSSSWFWKKGLKK